MPVLQQVFLGYPTASSTTRLLDSLSGTPKVAYSLRKLRSAYSGNAIKIRRSSDNTTTDIGFDGSGNLDTSAITSFVGANNAFVDTWYDQSGNGYNATQSTQGAQPRIVSSGTIDTLNSMPTLVFITANSTYMRATPSAWSGTSAAAIAVGSQTTSTSAAGRLISTSVGTNNDHDNTDACIFMCRLTTSSLNLFRNSSNRSTKTLTASQGFTAYSELDGTNATVYVDNSAGTTTAITGTYTNVSQVNIGASNQGASDYWDGAIAEVVLFTTNLSSGDRGTAYTNQKTYWGTP